MHIDCLQIYDMEYMQPSECEPFTGCEMYDALRPYVDYVNKYPDQEGAIKEWLKALEEKGCSINYEEQAFTVEDREKFAAFCLGWSEELNGKLSELDVSSYTGLASVMCRGMSAIYCRFPTISDDCGYGSLYEATKFDLYSDWYAGKRKTYKLIAVADCHF